MKPKSQSPYVRIASEIAGAKIAAQPRKHAAKSADAAVQKKNPQRNDLLRRHMISTSREKLSE